MNTGAQIAVKVAQERKAARIARIATAVVLGAALGLSAYLADPDEDMDLPEPGVMVAAWTGPHWCQAYVDSAGEFRSVEDGTRIGQVTKWEKP